MTTVIPNNISPIAIGALGGSGTRVVAEILIQAGIFMGDNLNDANDNLTFTCLFKRSEWYLNSHKKDRIRHLQVFEKLMTRQKLTVDERVIYSKAYFTNWNYTLKNKVKAPFKRKQSQQYIAWGWKEPNTHHYIKDLNEVFPNLRYIHVIRNGLDMAFSGNLQQLKNFGENYDIQLPSNKEKIPVAQMEYWIKANQHAIFLAKKTLGRRFYLLKFEDLCSNPGATIKNLFHFLNINLQETIIQQLSKLPNQPNSSGRYQNADLSIFSDEQLWGLQRLGYGMNSKIGKE